MKVSRTVAVFLLSAMLLSFGAWSVPVSAAEGYSAEAPTRLYYRTVPATKKALREQWPSNASENTMGNDGGMAHSRITIDGQTIPLQAYINDGTNGILEITLPKLSLSTQEYAEMELIFRYARFTDWEYDWDTHIEWANGFKVYASTDGGKHWSEDYATLKEHRIAGRGNDGDAVAIIYEAVSTELTQLVKQGETINALKIIPYGTLVGYNGFAHILSITVDGYRSQVPEPTKPAPEYIPVDEETLRQIVVDRMYEAVTIPWSADETVGGYLTDFVEREYPAGVTYLGPAYARGVDSSLTMLKSAITEDGKYTGPTGQWDVYGMDCCGIVGDAASTICGRPTAVWAYLQTGYVGSLKNGFVGTIPGYDHPLPSTIRTNEIIAAINETEDCSIYKCYAAARPGDMLLKRSGDVHARLITGEPIVEYAEDGGIDPINSYVIYSDTAATIASVYENDEGKLAYKATDGYTATGEKSSCRKDVKVSFATLASSYVPYTLNEYVTEQVVKQQVAIYDAPTAETVVADGVDVLLESNYHLDKVEIKLIDMATCETVFSDAAYSELDDHTMIYSDTDLNSKLKKLASGNYRLTIDVHSGPVTEVGGEAPVTRALKIDFAVGGATAIKPLDLTQADSWAVNWLNEADELCLLSQLNRQGFTADVTRLQFADMAVRAAQAITGKAIVPAPADSFTDTQNQSILKAKAAGIAGGYEVDGSFEFRPDKPITRQEICVMLAHVVEYVQANGAQVELNTEIEIAAGFPDRGEVADWASKQVALMTNNGIMGGRAADKGNMLTPNANTALQEAVTMSVKLMYLCKAGTT